MATAGKISSAALSLTDLIRTFLRWPAESCGSCGQILAATPPSGVCSLFYALFGLTRGAVSAMVTCPLLACLPNPCATGRIFLGRSFRCLQSWKRTFKSEQLPFRLSKSGPFSRDCWYKSKTFCGRHLDNLSGKEPDLARLFFGHQNLVHQHPPNNHYKMQNKSKQKQQKHDIYDHICTYAHVLSPPSTHIPLQLKKSAYRMFDPP